jgi:hypothetical protein
MAKKNIVIVSPHPDDEIIGCFEVVSNYKTFILYDESTTQFRLNEAMNLKDKFDIFAAVASNIVPPMWLEMKNLVLFFPDPVYETHPLHRQWGYVGEQMAREGRNVIFYNTIMNAPYIHEVPNFEEKKDALRVFKSQQNMWSFDHRYFLFEGYNSWKFNLSEVLK